MRRAEHIVPLVIYDREEQGRPLLHADGAGYRAGNIDRADQEQQVPGAPGRAEVGLAIGGFCACIVEPWADGHRNTEAEFPPHRAQLRLGQILPRCLRGLCAGFLERRRKGRHRCDCKCGHDSQIRL